MKVSVTIHGEGGTFFGTAPSRISTEIKMSDGWVAEEGVSMLAALTRSATDVLAAAGIEPVGYTAPVSDGDDASVGQTADTADKGSPEVEGAVDPADPDDLDSVRQYVESVGRQADAAGV